MVFPEMQHGQADRIAAARKVANPGCYPTGAIGADAPAGRCGFHPGGLSDHHQRGERLFGRRPPMIEQHDQTAVRLSSSMA